MSDLFRNFPGRLSRREFLQWTGSAFIGAALLPAMKFPRLIAPQDTAAAPALGRVTTAKIDGYTQPSYSAELIKSYWQDLVLNIDAAVLGDEESGHNRVWYRVDNESYVHSGEVQPVGLETQQPIRTIPAEGCLAEVTVPYTDAVWNVEKPAIHAYRLYYGTTHWIEKTIRDERGTYWYKLDDDKWPIAYYARSEHLRIVPAEEIAPLSPGVPPQEKRIEVRLPEQVIIAYEYDRPVFMARTATGAKFSDGDHTTPSGTYITSHKRPYRHMAAGDMAAANSYDLPGVPWVSYIMENGISFHGTYWHNNFGQPRSHGCINLAIPDALWVYRWTLPSVPLQDKFALEDFGTTVDVIDKPMG